MGRAKLHHLNPVPVQAIHERWIGKFTERAGVSSVLLALKGRLEGDPAPEAPAAPPGVGPMSTRWGHGGPVAGRGQHGEHRGHHQSRGGRRGDRPGPADVEEPSADQRTEGDGDVERPAVERGGRFGQIPGGVQDPRLGHHPERTADWTASNARSRSPRYSSAGLKSVTTAAESRAPNGPTSHQPRARRDAAVLMSSSSR